MDRLKQCRCPRLVARLYTVEGKFSLVPVRFLTLRYSSLFGDVA